FEDDFCFRRLPPETISAVTAAIPKTAWDIIYFGYLHPSDGGLCGPLSRLTSDHTIGGHFYSVNGPFIQPMLKFMQETQARPHGHPDGGSMCRDATYNHLRIVRPDIRVYLAVPSLAIQRSSRTDLHDLAIYDRIALLRPMMGAMRRLKTELHR